MPVGASLQRSISAAANLAVAGDTILVRGMVDNGPGGSGKEVAYTDVTFFTYQSPENFPILLRDGVTLKPATGSPRVIVTREMVGPAPVLIQMNNTSGLSAIQTTIRDIYLAGGSVGIELDSGTTTGATRNVLVDNVFFDSNSVGLSAISSGTNSSIEVDITNCRIADYASPTLLANPNPKFESQSIGIRIQAEDSGGSNAVIDATINSLSVIGPIGTAFSTMAPSTPPGSGSGYEPSFIERNTTGAETTRLIQVASLSGYGEHSETGTPAFPFATVNITGCSLDGRAVGGGDTGKGWDWGIHCTAKGDWGPGFDYSSGWDVTVSGCTIDDFREGGVLAYTRSMTRGLVHINGGTSITDSGFTGSGSGSKPYRHSGIYLESFESYVGIEGLQFGSSRNMGHGFFAYSQGSLLGSIYDTGVYVGLDRCQVFNNSGSGIELRNFNPAPGDTYFGTFQPAIVGSTWNGFEAGHLPDGLSIWEEDDEPMSGIIPIGQGSIANCQIYANTGHGVHASICGVPSSITHSICNRLVNCYLWENGGEAFRGDLDPNPISGFEGLMPSMFFPVIHNTFYHNGSGSFTDEIDDLDSSGISAGTFEFAEVLDPISLETIWLGTKLLSSIFDRGPIGGNDFGGVLDDLMERDLANGLLADDKIGVGGIRAVQVGTGYLAIPLRFIASTSDAPPYIGGTGFPGKWFLDFTGGTFSSFDQTLSFLSVPASEATTDFQTDPRPTILWQRDKGGDQAQ